MGRKQILGFLDKLSPRRNSGAMPNAAGLGIVLTAVLVCLGLSACGGGKKEAVVVRVGDNALTASTVEHWIEVESATSHGGGTATKPLPKGVMPVPPEYTDCIAYLESRATGGVKAIRNKARVECAVEYKQLKETILGILINDDWEGEEAAAKGVQVSDAEITHYLKLLYPHPGEFARHLKITHEKLADDRLLVRGKLLTGKLVALTTRNAHSEAEKISAVLARIREETAKWKPKTSCKPGYVVAQCKQYRGPQT